MSVVVIATLTAKPEAVDALREVLQAAVSDVHDEPGCQLYALHEADGAFVFVEQWADADALKTHSTSPTVVAMFKAAADHVAGPPDIKMLSPVPVGDPAKGRLRA